MTHPDVDNPHGRYRPSLLVATLILLAQRCPLGPAGQRLARGLGRLVLRRVGERPLDAAVGGLRLRFYLGDNNSERKFLLTPRRSDPTERALLARALPPDGVFVDIGANVSLYTLWAGRHLGPGGTLVAFEPHPTAFARLRFNVAANFLPGVTGSPRTHLLPVAVGRAENAGAVLHLHPRNLGANSLLPPAPGEDLGGKRLPVPCRPLLAVLDELGVARIDVLKIDVEGGEDAALVPFLEDADPARLPRFLIVENSAPRWREDLPGALRRRGYAVGERTKMNTVYRRPSPGDGAIPRDVQPLRRAPAPACE